MRVNRTFLVAAVALLALMLGGLGCEQGSPVDVERQPSSIETDLPFEVFVNGQSSHVVDLIADRSHDVGDVAFDDVDLNGDGKDDALQVVYSTTEGWNLISIDLWVGSSLSDMPDTQKGDPKPRKFPYRARRISDVTWAVTIPFEQIGYQCGNADVWYAAAHAIVKKQEGRWRHRTESAWSGDTRFRDKRGHWATYTTIVIDCDGEEPPPPTAHPAFAFDPANSWCLGDVGGGLGWTTPVFDAGTYVHVLYADPTGCGTDGLTVVGTVTLVYDGSSAATVTIEMSGPYTLDLAAVYYGGSETPPGSDPNTYTVVHTLSNATTDTFTITNFDPFSYFVAQASVKGF